MRTIIIALAFCVCLQPTTLAQDSDQKVRQTAKSHCVLIVTGVKNISEKELIYILEAFRDYQLAKADSLTSTEREKILAQDVQKNSQPLIKPKGWFIVPIYVSLSSINLAETEINPVLSNCQIRPIYLYDDKFVIDLDTVSCQLKEPLKISILFDREIEETDKDWYQKRVNFIQEISALDLLGDKSREDLLKQIPELEQKISNNTGSYRKDKLIDKLTALKRLKKLHIFLATSNAKVVDINIYRDDILTLKSNNIEPGNLLEKEINKEKWSNLFVWGDVDIVAEVSQNTE